MNYEKFNDAMCRLRQAEEDLNKALKDAYTAINEAFSQDDFWVGDEVICTNESSKNYNKKLIYLGRNGHHNMLCKLDDGEIQVTYDLGSYRKTGKHYNINF